MIMSPQSPVDAIKQWHNTLPKRVAGMVAEAVVHSLPGATLSDPSSLEFISERFDEWLSEPPEFPHQVIAKAAHFRSVFEACLAMNFEQSTWDDRRELMEGFVESAGHAPVTEKFLQEHEFQSAQWRAQRASWDELVARHLSDEQLSEYFEAAMATWGNES